MAEIEDTSAALRRLEAALNRIAAQVAKPRPVIALQDNAERDATAGDGPNEPVRHEIVTKLDDLIGGLRNALGIERHS
jgi:outer membrane protein TolC